MDEVVIQEMMEKVNDIIILLEEQPNESLVVVEELTQQLYDELETLLSEE